MVLNISVSAAECSSFLQRPKPCFNYTIFMSVRQLLLAEETFESSELRAITFGEIIFPLQRWSIWQNFRKGVVKDCSKRSLSIKRSNILTNWIAKIKSSQMEIFEGFLLTIQLRSCTVKGILKNPNKETILFKYSCHFVFLPQYKMQSFSKPHWSAVRPTVVDVIKPSCIPCLNQNLKFYI